jgi:rhamnulokinase
MNKYYLAIDLGASSGRHIIGYVKNNEIVLKEIYRFKTSMEESIDGFVWDFNRIFCEVKNGIKKAFKRYPNIVSLAIDAWGVDYVLMNGDNPISPFYAYRNERNIIASKQVDKIVPFNELYKMTGVQFASYNTIYQLFSDKMLGRLQYATDYLMVPNYLVYLLTGVKTHEYTNESTTGLLSPLTGKYLPSLIERLELPDSLFGSKISFAGDYVGELLPEIQKEVNGNCKVMLCASHDTASAFESIDIDDESIFISSGTWSLLGVKSSKPIISEKTMEANYTNEGGVGYIRFLKNIPGMWIANRLKAETKLTQEFIDKNIDITSYKVSFDINDNSLTAPKSMKKALLSLLEKCPPRSDLELFASIYRSMAISYKNAIESLENITHKKYKKIVIVGGGAKNNYLNRLVEEYTKKEVIPKPIEATALGNIKIQMKANENMTGGKKYE